MLPGYRSISIVLRHSRLFYLYRRAIVVVGAEPIAVKKAFVIIYSSSSILCYTLSGEAEGDTLFTAFNNIGANSSLAMFSKNSIYAILIAPLNR